jgi:hypothetical protein
VTALIALAAFGLWVPRSSSQTTNGFSGEADAAGITVTAATQEDPTGTTFQGAGPVTTALVSSVPDSQAFAADPYPGKDLLNLANIVGAMSPAPLPSYPVAVQSASPGQGQASLAQPGYSIRAASGPTSSEGSAEAGVVSSGTSFASVQSDSKVVAAPDGSVDALATTAADAVVVGPLTISAVRSRAESVLDAAGNVKSTSSLVIGEVAVNGVAVGFTDKGLTIAGTDTPLPSAGPLAAVLQQAGVTFTYLAAAPQPNGVTAPGVALTAKQTDPNGKTVTITYILGQATTSAAPTAGGPTFGGGSATFGNLGPATPSAATPAPATNPVSALSLPTTGAGTPTTGGVGSPAIAAPVGNSRAPRVEVGPAPTPNAERNPGTARITPASTSQTGDLGGLFYLILILAAGAVMGAGQLVRFMGVRWARSSA